jgi:hypothetical protein
MASVIENVDRCVSLADSGAERLRWTQLHRDDRGNPELFVLVYAVKTILHDGGLRDGARTPRQRRRTEPFLRRWQGAMALWASRNGDALKDSLSGHEFGRMSRLVLTSDCVPVTPATPAPPGSSSPVLRALDPFPASPEPLLPAL